jgi:hypothetical protein
MAFGSVRIGVSGQRNAAFFYERHKAVSTLLFLSIAGKILLNSHTIRA